MQTPWILIAVLALLILFGILAIILFKSRKGKSRPIDYYNWFIIGIVWIAIEIIWIKENAFFFIMGLVFLAISLIHHKDWKKNREANKWKNLSKTERKIKLWVIILLGILVLAGLVAFFLVALI